MLPKECFKPRLVRVLRALLRLIYDLGHFHFVELDEGHLILGAWCVEGVYAV